jgi:hypothetical protein
MNRRQPPGIWVANHLANPVLRPCCTARPGTGSAGIWR